MAPIDRGGNVAVPEMPGGDNAVRPVREIIDYALSVSGHTTYSVDNLGLPGLNSRVIRRSPRYFSSSNETALLSLVEEKRLRARIEVQLKYSLAAQKAKKFDDGTGTIPDFRSRSKYTDRELWFMRLIALEDRHRLDRVLITSRTARNLYDILVADVRVAQGEREAYRNVIVLLKNLMTAPRATKADRSALLGLFYHAADLAAQLNKHSDLWSFAGELEAIAGEFDGAAEKLLVRRLVSDMRSRSLRYDPQFDWASNIRRDAGAYAEAAIEGAESGVALSLDPGNPWREVTVGWLGSYFGLLNHAVNVGWPRGQIVAMFGRHDEIARLLAPIDPGAMLLTDMLRTPPTDNPYAGEFFATLALCRESPNETPRRRNYDAMDIDKSMEIAESCLVRVDASNHYGDSIVGGLLIAKLDALLCRHGSFMPQSVRDEYDDIRTRAIELFDRMGMNRKMTRVRRLERALGLVVRDPPGIGAEG